MSQEAFTSLKSSEEEKNMKSSFIQWSIKNESESINLILWIPYRRQRKGFDNPLKGLKAVDKLIRIRLHKFDSFSCCHFALSDKIWTFFFLMQTDVFESCFFIYFHCLSVWVRHQGRVELIQPKIHWARASRTERKTTIKHWKFIAIVNYSQSVLGEEWRKVFYLCKWSFGIKIAKAYRSILWEGLTGGMEKG